MRKEILEIKDAVVKQTEEEIERDKANILAHEKINEEAIRTRDCSKCVLPVDNEDYCIENCSRQFNLDMNMSILADFEYEATCLAGQVKKYRYLLRQAEEGYKKEMEIVNKLRKENPIHRKCLVCYKRFDKQEGGHEKFCSDKCEKEFLEYQEKEMEELMEGRDGI